MMLFTRYMGAQMPYNPELTGERMNEVNEASPVERVVIRH